MKIVNETDWETKDLRAFALEALRQYPAQTKQIEFVYNRSGGLWSRTYITGQAVLGGSWVKIRLPKPTHMVKVAGSDGSSSFTFEPTVINSLELAAVLTHEFAHNRGLQHGDMADSIANCSVTDGENLSRFAWASAFNVGLKPKVEVVKPVVDLKLKRKVKVESKLGKLLHQRELLDARIKKLEKKAKYYSKVAG